MELPSGPEQLEEQLDTYDLVLLVNRNKPLINRMSELCDRARALVNRDHLIPTPECCLTQNRKYPTLADWLGNNWLSIMAAHHLLDLHLSDIHANIANGEPIESLSRSDRQVVHLSNSLPLVRAHIGEIEALIAKEESRAQVEAVHAPHQLAFTHHLPDHYGFLNESSPAPAPA